MKTEKTIKITAPTGYEIDRAKSTLEEIVFKPIEPVKEKYPMSVKEIEGRDYYITNNGKVDKITNSSDINNLKTEVLASAFLALMQLKTICDEWNRIDGFVVDWTNGGIDKYSVEFQGSKLVIDVWSTYSHPLIFKDRATAQLFLDSFKEMIETAKPLL